MFGGIYPVQGGDEWETKTTGALKRSHYLIVVLTPDAVELRWVRRDICSR